MGSAMTPSPSRQALIRDFNDAMRIGGPTGAGRWVLTRGVLSLGEDLVACVLTKVRAFDRFDADNDPHDEHDFGSFEVCGQALFWKIDYYDIDLEHGSEDPADAAITTRILTLMLAEEY
jgi:hypothetical protein